MNRARIVCLVGPTASGKTALALELAERRPIEVISADSRQVYRGLDVGTGKPTAAERARVPHHGLDVIEPTEEYDAGRFAAMARAAIDDAHGRGRDAVVVGGTGLYVRSLLRGLAPAPPRSPALRSVLGGIAAAGEPGLLHRWLARLDPPTAARVHRNDPVRVVRGLEIVFLTGRPLSWWQAQATTPAPWTPLVIGLDVAPPELDARIAARVDAMGRAGWLDEVAQLMTRLPTDAPAWRTVGYREWRAHLEGALSADEARTLVVRATRQFAKRQRTWFRAHPELQWRDPDADRGALLDELAAFLDGSGA